VDPCVQDLQGKAERVKPTEILQRLLAVYVEKAALLRRHVAVARLAGQYDVNNTYQYVIAREGQHLEWLADAIRGLDGTVPDAQGPGTLPAIKGDEALRGVAGEDARAIDAFVEAWRPRADAISNARHRLMLTLMFGEMQEQARLLHQASTGRLDLLGRRTGGDRMPGSVLPTRWVE
jgi:hypothetical protein